MKIKCSEKDKMLGLAVKKEEGGGISLLSVLRG